MVTTAVAGGADGAARARLSLFVCAAGATATARRSERGDSQRKCRSGAAGRATNGAPPRNRKDLVVRAPRMARGQRATQGGNEILEEDVLRLKKKLLMMAGAMLLPTAALVAGFSGVASAATYSGTGTVTCGTVAGGIVFSPPLMLPSIGYAGPVADKGYVDIHLGSCTSTDGSVSFSGLNGNSAVQGDATGVIASKQNNVTGLAGSSTPFHLTVTWYGEGAGALALAPTHVTVSGDMPYQGLLNDPGNIGFFLGTTTNTGNAFGFAGPAGFQSFETTSGNDMPPFSGTDDCGQTGYAWPCMPSPGGSTTATVTPKAGATTTNTLCVAQSVLGAYSYTKTAGQGYLIPGLGGPASGLLGTVSGSLKDDVARGDGTNVVGNPNVTMAGDYISAYSASNAACTTQLGVAAGTISLANPSGAALAKVTTSASPSAGTLTVGEPLSVSGIPASMATASTNPSILGQLCNPAGPYKPNAGATTQAGDIITYQDGGSPDSLCTLKDAGAFSVPGGVGQTAVWAFGSTANDIPPAATAPTLGVAANGCTSAANTPIAPHPDTILKQTGCNLVSATGSFAATASSATLYGDATTGFATEAEVEGAATGAYNGYGGTDNPDPDGISYIAIAATDGLTL
jgi:hypothetical protein